jgi:NDP-sugar pyrophosphorylase family protein
MNNFQPKAFFELHSRPVTDLFTGVTNTWEAMTFLPEFIQTTVKPEVLGDVEDGAWLEPGKVELGEGSRIERGAIIRGPTIIGRKTLIRSGAYIRPNVMVGDECIIGHGTELRRSVIMNQTKLPHLNCIMVSFIGNRVTFGAGAATSSIVKEAGGVKIKVTEADGSNKWVPTGLARFGAIIGDDFECGGQVFMKPGTVIGKGCKIDPLISLSGYIKAGSSIEQASER